MLHYLGYCTLEFDKLVLPYAIFLIFMAGLFRIFDPVGLFFEACHKHKSSRKAILEKNARHKSLKVLGKIGFPVFRLQ